MCIIKIIKQKTNTAFGRLELEAEAVWEKNTVGLAGAGDWSGVRRKYCCAEAGAGCRTQWKLEHQLEQPQGEFAALGEPTSAKA